MNFKAKMHVTGRGGLIRSARMVGAAAGAERGRSCPRGPVHTPVFLAGRDCADLGRAIQKPDRTRLVRPVFAPAALSPWGQGSG